MPRRLLLIFTTACMLIGMIFSMQPPTAKAARLVDTCFMTSDIRGSSNLVFFNFTTDTSGGTYGWNVGNYKNYIAKVLTEGVTLTLGYWTTGGSYVEYSPVGKDVYTEAIPSDTTMFIMVVSSATATVEVCSSPPATATFTPPPASTATNSPILTATPSRTPNSSQLTETASVTYGNFYVKEVATGLVGNNGTTLEPINGIPFGPYTCNGSDRVVEAALVRETGTDGNGGWSISLANGSDSWHEWTTLTKFWIHGYVGYNQIGFTGSSGLADMTSKMYAAAGDTPTRSTGFDDDYVNTVTSVNFRLRTDLDTSYRAILGCYGGSGPTLTPTPIPGQSSNLICDGDMEEYFDSTCWLQSDFGSITRPNGSIAPYTWDRLNTFLAPWPLSWSNWWTYGDAACGTGYQGVGKNALIGTNVWTGTGKGAASAIEQGFTWAGGTLNWRISARGKFMRFLPATPPGKAVATIFGDAVSYALINEAALTVGWTTFHGSLDLPAGNYNLKLDSWDKQNFLINTIDDGSVYYDDVFLTADVLTGNPCEDLTNDITPTPDLTQTQTATAAGTVTPNATGTVTATPTGTITPSTTATIFVTPTGMGNTITPDGSPTATPNADLLFIWNCGFEAGSNNWGLNQVSSIVLAGGPTGPQALRATGDNPSAWQNFISKGANTYLTAWIKGRTGIRAYNLDTQATIDYYVGEIYEWEWKKIYQTAYIPAGNWRLELNTSDPPAGEGFFDGITLAYNTYATAAQSWCAVEPTPGPTPFLTATPSRTITMGATSTPWPSSTIAPWYTPIATGTPQPSTTPQPSQTPNVNATNYALTATALGTPNTGNQTATAQAATLTAVWGTATAMGTSIPGGTITPGGPGTGTPSFQGTPMATPPYGSGGIGGSNPGVDGMGPCPKPDFWKDGLGAWVDGAVCEAKAFMTFGPGNIDQVNQFTKDLKKQEPFGTVSEMTDALQAVKSLVNSYNWTNSGLPGTHTRGIGVFTVFTDKAPGWITGFGGFQIQGGGPTYRMSCSAQVAGFVGPRISPGMCFIFDILYQNNLMPVFQFFVDGSSLLALFFYIRNQWLKYM